MGDYGDASPLTSICDVVVGAGADPALRNACQVALLVTLQSDQPRSVAVGPALAEARRLEMTRPLRSARLAWSTA